MASPRGVDYQPPASTEFQLFPEEYFSGCDVSIYFGDIWVDDITGLSFQLQEKKRPIFGYASRTYDAMATGTRIAAGMFKIAFKEAGYLNAILSHIGQVGGDVRPAMSYMMAGEAVPEWHAKIQEKIEDILNRYRPEPQEQWVEETYVPNWPTRLEYGNRSQAVSELKTVLSDRGYENGGRDYGHWAPMPLQYGHRNQSVKELTRRLWEFGVLEDQYNDGRSDFDTCQVLAVKELQARCGLPQTGVVDLATRTVLEAKPETDHNYYGSNTMLRVVAFQRDHQVGTTGVVGNQTRGELAPKLTRRINTSSSTIVSGSAEDRFTAYEREIWGRDFSSDTEHKYQPHFYSDKAVQGAQSNLLKSGFNIYITYGPIEAKLASGTTQARYDINHTVKALRNVHLEVVGQVIAPNGQPIEEVYSFIAKDID